MSGEQLIKVEMTYRQAYKVIEALRRLRKSDVELADKIDAALDHYEEERDR